MKDMIRTGARVLTLALCGLAWGCAQQAGELCQVDSDCADGLVCDPAQSVREGRCIDPDDEPPANTDDGAGQPDAATDEDAG